MNREIKFRAWDNDFGSMIYEFIEGYIVSMDYGELKIGSHDGNKDYFELPVMQFTGLKDKNGKEIYEGDIIRPDNGKYTYQIKYVHAQFTTSVIEYDLRNTSYYLYTFLYHNKCEIIGNIYQNKELLNQ